MISTKTLKVDREMLVLQLAAAALAEEASFQGANKEYERARGALAALAMDDTITVAARMQFQQEKAWHRRAIINCGLLGFICFMCLALMSGWIWG